MNLNFSVYSRNILAPITLVPSLSCRYRPRWRTIGVLQEEERNQEEEEGGDGKGATGIDQHEYGISTMCFILGMFITPSFCLKIKGKSEGSSQQTPAPIKTPIILTKAADKVRCN